MRDRIVGDIAAIQSDGLAVEKVGERLVGRGGISQRTGSQGNAADEIFAQLAIEAEAHSDAAAVPILERSQILKEAFTANPDVTGKAEAAQQTFQSRHALLLFLRSHSRVGQSGLHIRHVAVQLDDRLFLAAGQGLCGSGLHLCVAGCALGLLQLLLGLLPGLIFLLHFLLELLNLLLLGSQRIFQRLQIMLGHSRLGRLACRLPGSGFSRSLRHQRSSQQRNHAPPENGLHYFSFLPLAFAEDHTPE